MIGADGGARDHVLSGWYLIMGHSPADELVAPSRVLAS
jgi:hypothetical protein